MILKSEKIILRDMIEKDIEDRIYWETVETEWQDWDAPWENELGFNIEEFRERKLKEINSEKDEEEIRYSFQICINDKEETHIGWCSAYHIDDKFEYTKKYGEITIGIDIPEIKYRKKGYASHTWALYIDYLLDSGVMDIYTQTWSGNTAVLALMKKMGFKECDCKFMNVEVRGNLYHSLTLKLDIEEFKKVKRELL